MSLALRDLRPEDLPLLFEQQRDPPSRRQAAFTLEDPDDRQDFLDRWTRVLGDPAVIAQAVLLEGELIGNVVSFLRERRREVAYWIDVPWRSQGHATTALRLLLADLPERPLFARAAKDNLPSLRVLQKCGFLPISEGRAWSHSRQQEVEEWILELPT